MWLLWLLLLLLLVAGEDLAEHRVVGLEALGGPVGAPRVQRQELEGAGLGHGAVTRPPQLDLHRHRLLDLQHDTPVIYCYLRYLWLHIAWING